MALLGASGPPHYYISICNRSCCTKRASCVDLINQKQKGLGGFHVLLLCAMGVVEIKGVGLKTHTTLLACLQQLHKQIVAQHG